MGLRDILGDIRRKLAADDEHPADRMPHAHHPEINRDPELYGEWERTDPEGYHAWVKEVGGFEDASGFGPAAEPQAEEPERSPDR